jgi:aconitate hydratase
MIELVNEGIYLVNGKKILSEKEYIQRQNSGDTDCQIDREQAKKNTISSGILKAHNMGDEKNLKLKFDSLTSHDMTNVGIIQTARACGLKAFPLPVVLTNCQNTLCAIGGTINRDDHIFALTAAQKYGGINVPVNTSVIHTYMREMMAGCGSMIMGADSHTRYGALGTMGIGEGGGELVKQILGQSYDLKAPKVIAVYLSGNVRPGVGPHDVALAIVGNVFKNGFVKNSVLEFVGDGVDGLSMDYRNGIDVMTTETGCLTSIWKTDEVVRKYMQIHGREQDYRELLPGPVSYYDRMVYVNLDKVKPMIALPFHPSNVYSVDELNENPQDILRHVEKDARGLTGNDKLDLMCKYHDGAIYVDSGSIGGCSGGCFENLMAVSQIMAGADMGSGPFDLTVYPDSQPTNLELLRHGATAKLMQAGVICREAICGPCTGVGEIPANNEFSIRHNTRNFIYREGARPGDGQHAWVGLMDARSIAATAVNGGRLTSAETLDVEYSVPEYHFDKGIYNRRVYYGVGSPKPEVELIEGPNIKPWPEMPEMAEHLLLKLCSYIDDEVTTTDELIPSGDTSSYRSNPIQMSTFTLYRRDPAYVGEAQAVQEVEVRREMGENVWETEELKKVLAIMAANGMDIETMKAGIGIGSAIYSRKPGDGSAREQAASCQKVLGGMANITETYATRRYRANLINWGILPFEMTNAADKAKFGKGTYILLPNIRKQIEDGAEAVEACILKDNVEKITLTTGELSRDERAILTAGCMINHCRKTM